jgi:hypothetical protein
MADIYIKAQMIPLFGQFCSEDFLLHHPLIEEGHLLFKFIRKRKTRLKKLIGLSSNIFPDFLNGLKIIFSPNVFSSHSHSHHNK